MIDGKMTISQHNLDVLLAGEEILEKFKFVQLRTRITYERSL